MNADQFIEAAADKINREYGYLGDKAKAIARIILPLVREDVRPDKGVATTDTLTPQGADGRQAPMTEPLEDEAMSIIRRAAVLLKERGDGCCTPGAHYETNLSLPNEMSIKVTLSEEQSARLQEQIEKHPYRVPYMDNVLHDYFQVAVAKILAGDVI